KLKLVGVALSDGATREQVLRLAGAVESASEHPVARAIASMARDELGSLPAVERFRNEPGVGVAGVVEGREVRVGRSDGRLEVACEASDLTLVSGDLRAAADAIRLARRTLRTIKGNLFWAFAYNVAAVPLAVAGLLNPIIAAAAMASSSLFVVTNSLRLRRFRSSRVGVA